MKVKGYLKEFLFMTVVIAVLFSACVPENKKGMSSAMEKDSVETGAVFVTDLLHLSDSFLLGGNKANVNIDGQYPMAGSSRLVDSTREWLAERLSYGGYCNGNAQFEYDSALLADGKSLVAIAAKACLDSAKVDFESFMQDSMFNDGSNIIYEHMYTFAPTFMSDSILTYHFSGYAYLGGAHGSSVGAGQTFVVSTGKRLGLADMFLPDSELKLRDLVREGLGNQYFGTASTNGENVSMNDALLVSPDTLPLPAFPPLCVDTGMVFVYQQYEIAYYAAGMPACVLPYRVLKPLMRPEAARLLPE